MLSQGRPSDFVRGDQFSAHSRPLSPSTRRHVQISHLEPHASVSGRVDHGSVCCRDYARTDVTPNKASRTSAEKPKPVVGPCSLVVGVVGFVQFTVAVHGYWPLLAHNQYVTFSSVQLGSVRFTYHTIPLALHRLLAASTCTRRRLLLCLCISARRDISRGWPSSVCAAPRRATTSQGGGETNRTACCFFFFEHVVYCLTYERLPSARGRQLGWAFHTTQQGPPKRVASSCAENAHAWKRAAPRLNPTTKSPAQQHWRTR